MSRFCIYFSFVFKTKNKLKLIYSILDLKMTINGGFALNGNQSFQNLTRTPLEMCSNSPLTGYFRNGK